MACGRGRADGSMQIRRHAGRSRFVAAVVAVVVVGGATSATAGGLITGKQIKDGTIRGRDLANGKVAGTDVRDGVLSVSDFDQESIRGPQGAPGPQGDPGPRGVGGIPGVEFSFVAFSAVGTGGGLTSHTMSCPTSSRRAVSGGVSSLNPDKLEIVESTPIEPTASAEGKWLVMVKNHSSSSISAFGWITCVTP
jgi:hypothetical protein